MIKTLGNNIVNAFTGGNPVKAIYTYGEKVWPISGPEPTEYYIKWTPSTAEGQFNVDGTTYDLSAFSGTYYWSTGIINPSAFQNNYSVQSIETNATSIGFRAFMSCSSLSQVNLPMCSYIGSTAFYSCSSLSQISLPVCEYVGNDAFDGCSSLSQISLPMCSYIGDDAFIECYSLTQVSLPVCSFIGGGAFEYCTSLTQVSLPMCISVWAVAFEYCTSLTQVSLPMCELIGARAFEYCSSLTQIDLPMCSYMDAAVFRYCSSLSRITIRYSSVCSLYSPNIFDGTKITSSTGSISVPASLVNAYKSASGWKYYSNRIYSIR